MADEDTHTPVISTVEKSIVPGEDEKPTEGLPSEEFKDGEDVVPEGSTYPLNFKRLKMYG